MIGARVSRLFYCIFGLTYGLILPSIPIGNRKIPKLEVKGGRAGVPTLLYYLLRNPLSKTFAKRRYKIFKREKAALTQLKFGTTVIEHIEQYHEDELRKNELVLDSSLTVFESLGQIRRLSRADDGATAARLSELGLAWVKDEHGVLDGYVGATELLLGEPFKRVSDITKPLPVIIRAEDSLENAVQSLRQENFAVAPIIDDSGVLVTAFSPSEVMAAMDAEASEDVAKLALSGGVGSTYFDANVNGIVKNRFSWLLSLLLLQSLSSAVLASFSSLLSSNLLLAVFLTTITGTSGNAGNQASAVVIRGLATGDINARNDTLRVIRRELSIAAPISIGLGLASFLRVIFTAGNAAAAIRTAFVITAAMASTVIAAIAVGAGAPLLLARNNIDPVTCASPVLATFVDLIGVIILCSIGNCLLPRTALIPLT